LLEALGDTAAHQGIGALLTVDTLRPEPIGQPVMLVQTDPRREGKVRAEPDEHPAPVAIVDVEVVLHLSRSQTSFALPRQGRQTLWRQRGNRTDAPVQSRENDYDCVEKADGDRKGQPSFLTGVACTS
jgi:hypothetical protein